MPSNCQKESKKQDFYYCEGFLDSNICLKQVNDRGFLKKKVVQSIQHLFFCIKIRIFNKFLSSIFTNSYIKRESYEKFKQGINKRKYTGTNLTGSMSKSEKAESEKLKEKK